MTFYANRNYNASLDVRDLSVLSERIQQEPPGGTVWLLVAPRRGRKTWTLRGLERILPVDRAKFLDIQGEYGLHKLPEVTPEHGYYFLLDEAHAILKNPDLGLQLVTRCGALHARGARVIMAVTPAECQLLLDYGQHRGHVSTKAIIGIAPLSLEEAQQLASRNAEAQALLGNIPIAWRQSAFRLELLFEQMEEYRKRTGGHSSASIDKLIQAAREWCLGGAADYIRHAFREGLNPAQQQLVRRVACGDSINPRDAHLLITAGVIGLNDHNGRFFVADPILEAELAPLRIHHISDIHVGPKSAETVDAKEKGSISIAADTGKVRDSYVQHLAKLKAEDRAPHLVVISGDLTEYGTEEQLAEARAWVDSIRPELAEHPLLDPNQPRFLLVGGNHDVNWTLAMGGDPQARHRPFARTFSDLPRPSLEEAPDERKVATVYYSNLDLEFLLLGSAEMGGQIEDAQERHLLLLELATLADPKTEPERKKALELALQAARDDPGLVHEQDLRRADAHRYRGKLRIAVLHHPVSALPKVTEIARYAGLLNAGAVKDLLLQHKFSLVLHGHTHSAWFGIEHWPGLHDERKLHIASAPSLSSREVSENHGYNAIEIHRDFDENAHRTYELRVRRVLRKGTHNWQDSQSMPTIRVRGAK